MARTIYMRVAFDGTEFHGWQYQPGLRTVQDVLQEALRRVVRHPVDLVGSGRTDAGVHAAGHVSSFVTTCDLEPARLYRAVASRLSEDVAILELREVHGDFHATSAALAKLYRYRVYLGDTLAPHEGLHRYVFRCRYALDMERMQSAARHFEGEMDFTSMTPARTARETMVRRVFRCDIERVGEEIRIDVEGDGFLYRQVRTMVGTLLEVGRGHWEPDHVASVLACRDRTAAGPTALAHGLCLQWVRYPPELLIAPERSVVDDPEDDRP